MTLLCRVQRIFSKSIWVVIAFALSASAGAAFRDNLDRRIARDIVLAFAGTCALKVAAELETSERLKLEAAEARKSKFVDVQKCFDTYFSQIQGVVFVYEKTCNEVTSTISQTLSENRLAWQLLSISKYEQGMRPFHSALNDCLLGVPSKRGRRFVVPLVSAGFNVTELKSQLDAIEVKDPYVHTPEPFR